LLASHGYAALVVGYFGLDGIDAQLVSIPLERLADGVRALAADAHVDATRIGALAISRGSEGVLSMAARLDDVPLAAIVAISPSRVSWTAMGDEGTMPGVPSWTVAGQPVPHLDVADKVLMDQAMRDAFRDRGKHDPYHPHLMHLARSYATALDNTAGADAAAIPVERIAAPLLLLSGSDDEVWPSGPMADAILARRQGTGTPATKDYHQHYEGGGHLLRLGCMPTDVTATSGIALGGTRVGIAAAQADATTRVLEFFRSTLG
jgi:dienelactone hydrolase